MGAAVKPKLEILPPSAAKNTAAPDLHAKAPGALCSKCPLQDHPFVRPKPKRALLALIGERPDKYEVEKGYYFAGPSGELLHDRILPQAGLKGSEVSFHNAVCCTVDRKLSPGEWKQAIACCAPRLVRDLRASQPKALVAAGKRALQALTGRAQITAWTGAPLQGWAFRHHESTSKKGVVKVELVELKPGSKDRPSADFRKYSILPVMHPAWHFRGNNIAYLPVSRIHLKRAKALGLGKLPEWRWPPIEIEANERALRLLERLRDAGRKGARISFDVESIGDNPFTDDLSCLGVGHRDIGAVSLIWEDYDAGKYGHQLGVLRPTATPIEVRCRDLLLSILRDVEIDKVAQNGQYDLMCLWRRGVVIRGPRKTCSPKIRYAPFDTMIGHAVYANEIAHNLALICSIEFHAPRWKDDFQAGAGEVKGKAKFQKSDPVKLRTYNGKDDIMQSHVEGRETEVRFDQTHRGWELFDNYMAVQAIANEMCFRGVKVDRERRAFHHRALLKRMARARKELNVIAKRAGLPKRTHTKRKKGGRVVRTFRAYFNPDSRADWLALFFGKFKVKPSKWSETTGEPSLDESVLTPLATHPNQLVQFAAKAGLRYRRWATIDRSQVRGLRLDARNVIHPFWKTTGTIGLRWSGSKPNPQNILQPIEERLPSGKKKQIHGGLRDQYIPHCVDGWIVEGDEKQLELRIIAALAGDKPLIDTFAAFDAGLGPDPHTVNAMDLFGVHGEACRCGSVNDRKVTKRERTLAKNFVYNVNYGGDAASIHPVLAVDTPIEMSVVEILIERWFAKHQAIKRWQDKIAKEAREKGYVEEPVSGRRRHFWSKPKVTEVYNYPVQTLAGWILNEAIKKVAPKLDWKYEGILFQVHDALVLDGPDPFRLASIIQKDMTVELTLNGNKMLFPCDIKVGQRWGELEEMDMQEIAKLPKGERRMAA